VLGPIVARREVHDHATSAQHSRNVHQRVWDMKDMLKRAAVEDEVILVAQPHWKHRVIEIE
jgi:hypothetical protein